MLTLPSWGAQARLDEHKNGMHQLFIPVGALQEHPQRCQILQGWPAGGVTLRCQAAIWNTIKPPKMAPHFKAQLQWSGQGVRILPLNGEQPPEVVMAEKGLWVRWPQALQSTLIELSHLEIQYDEAAWHLFLGGASRLPEPQVNWLADSATLVVDWPNTLHAQVVLPRIEDPWVKQAQLGTHDEGVRLAVTLKNANLHWRLDRRDGRYQLTLSKQPYHSAWMKSSVAHFPQASYQFIQTPLSEAVYFLAQRAALDIRGLELLQPKIEDVTLSSTPAHRALAQLLDQYGWQLQTQKKGPLQIVRAH
ncbi:hypothetical protein [Magnetococcus sp. PR-3]|uniref:hypothetical protein n=1 Tax=Magnetococcus sp. PR-3 TaxID=3120355 RepID=UPI002FCE4D78